MEKKKKFYGVARGRNTGIFSAWFGPGGAEAQIKAFPGARYKGFATIEEARQWMAESASGSAAQKKPGAAKQKKAPSEAAHHEPSAGQTVIYTDGGCSYNPGPGGYGAVILAGAARRELSGGFRLTTNNRMELMGCIEALKALADASPVMLFSDSKYVVDAVTKGWAKKWQRNGWMRTPTDMAENHDLWAELLKLCDRHRVDFVWVKGHAGTVENERCDVLATTAAAGSPLPADAGYDARQKKSRLQLVLRRCLEKMINATCIDYPF